MPVKAGTKRKTTGKSGGTRHRKVKVVSDTDEGSDSTTAKEKEEIDKQVGVGVGVHMHVGLGVHALCVGVYNHDCLSHPGKQGC